MCTSNEGDEPASFHEGLLSPNSTVWKTPMRDEINSMENNQVRELADLLYMDKSIRSNSVLKIKCKPNGPITSIRPVCI